MHKKIENLELKIKKVYASQFYRYSKWLRRSWSTRRDYDENVLISSFQVYKNLLRVLCFWKEKKKVKLEEKKMEEEVCIGVVVKERKNLVRKKEKLN